MSKTENTTPSDLIWAEDVLTVYRNLGKIITTKSLEGSSSAKALHDWVNADAKNETTFLTSMVQKATEIKQKYSGKEIDDKVVEPERKTILDLKFRLAEAVDESKEVTP